jgi:phosphoribosyl-AMP cyclohydrolase
MYKVNTKLDVNEFKLNAAGLLPVIAQDYESGEVLFLGQMNAEALEKTAETGMHTT